METRASGLDLERLTGEQRSAVLSVVHSPGWVCLEAVLQGLELGLLRSLADTNEVSEIYKLQGEIRGVRRLSDLRSTLGAKQPLPRNGMGRY